MTIVTMGLSCVLFVVVANCLGNMDEEYEARKNVEYGRFQIELQYSNEDTGNLPPRTMARNQVSQYLTRKALNRQNRQTEAYPAR